MNAKITIILLAVCLMTGCGKNENTVTDIEDAGNNANYKTEVTDEPTNQPEYDGVKIYTEEDFEDEDYYEDEDEEYDEEIQQRDLSDIIGPIKGKVYNEVKTTSKKEKDNDKEPDFSEAAVTKQIGDNIVAFRSKNYHLYTLNNLERNLQQKQFQGECVKVENHSLSLYNIAQIHEGDVNDIDVEVHLDYDSMSGIEFDYTKYNIYCKNKATKDIKKLIFECKTGETWEIYDAESSMATHDVKGNMLAIITRYSMFSKCGIFDMEDKSYHIVDCSQLADINHDENGRLKNDAYDETDVIEMSFVGKNKIALKLRNENIFIYDIKEKCVTDGLGKYDTSLDDGICNLTYKNDDGTYDYYAIDLDTMQIVSHVENPDRYFIDFMGLYKDGVTYFTNSYGLYAYNPETKGYDCIYDQMENDTEYTWEKIKDDKYRDVFVKPLFKGNDIYLCRGIRCADDCVDWEEAICKKLTIK